MCDDPESEVLLKRPERSGVLSLGRPALRASHRKSQISYLNTRLTGSNSVGDQNSHLRESIQGRYAFLEDGKCGASIRKFPVRGPLSGNGRAGAQSCEQSALGIGWREVRQDIMPGNTDFLGSLQGGGSL